jgi:3'-phosphoadenosine 5'-phosphosulfate sulfotransferase (PAPS reductase)/FAD synthetase
VQTQPLANEQLCLDVPESASAPRRSFPPWFNSDIYQEHLQQDPDYVAGYPHLNETGAAFEKTYAFLCALNACLLPSVAIVINSSTGKDSTLMTALYISAMKRWREQGRTLRSVLIQVSDTNSEFPEMALRMRAEVAALNQYGIAENLPLRAILVSPIPKHRLLVELIGNGKPMPKLSGSASRNGLDASSWCMSRLKGGVLDKALKLAHAEFPTFVQCLGVRVAESSKRAATIQKYALDDLPAVSRLGDDIFRLGFCPIAHWDDSSLRNWMVEAQRNPAAECPWRPEGVEELISIYVKGSGENENPNECALVITKDGSVSNSCSDLTGTRMGCVFCLLSINRSLANTARKDSRYVWLKKCHELLYANHAKNQNRVKLRNASGFSVETLFPKSFTFEERYKLLVHIFRAELESGFELLQHEDLDAISLFWEKHGIYTVTIDEAREDARRWKETNNLEFTYQKNIRFADVLARELGEGIPAGAFFPGTDNIQPLNLAHLVGVSAGGFGSPIVPTLLSYIFLDRRKSDRLVVMVTDVPSVIGTKTNTGLLSGLVGAAWECVSIRQPTAWERSVSDGRIFFYATDLNKEKAKAEAELEEGLIFSRAVDRFHENTRAAYHGCPEDPLAESIMLDQDIPTLEQGEYERLFVLCGKLAYASDELSYCIMHQSHAAVRNASGNPDMLEAPEGKAYRAAFRKQLVSALDLRKHVELFRFYAKVLREILDLLRKGKASCGLIHKFCFLARLDAVDPDEAEKEWKLFLGAYLDHAQPLAA